MKLFDAHNHLQDERFGGRQAELLAACQREGVVRMVVNGSCEADWPTVLELARGHRQVLPSFGYHPWHVGARTPDWRQRLGHFLDQVPGAVGEIGLDRWILEQPAHWQKAGGEPPAAPAPLVEQEAVFLAQLQMAAERDLPVSIHCLRAWGRLHELLDARPRPRRGFLLHSYGGPREMVPAFVKLGAYFSFPGYYAHARKARQREAFQSVPVDRLLLETDAPDQPLPDALNAHPLVAAVTGQGLNHPANLGAVYRFVAQMLDEGLEALADRVEENFARLFGGR